MDFDGANPPLPVEREDCGGWVMEGGGPAVA